MPFYHSEKLKYVFPPIRVSLVVVAALMPASLVIALQASLYSVNEKWFTELDVLCSTSVASCPSENSYQPGELFRSKIQLENIAILFLHLWVLCMIFAAIEWHTKAQLPFTFVQISSRPVFFVGQIVRTTKVRSEFPGPSASLALRFRLEVVELAMWTVFFGGFIWYAHACWKRNKNVREIWLSCLSYPLVFSLSFFAIEISLRRPSPLPYISTVFMVVTVIMAVVLSGMRWYHRRSVASGIKVPKTIVAELPRPVQIPRASAWATTITPTMPLAREDTGAVDQQDMLRVSGSHPSYHDVNVAPVQPPLNDGPNFEDTFSASVTPMDIDTHPLVNDAASDSLPTPSTALPSSFRSPPPSFTSRAPSVSQMSRNDSFNSVTTLPSYHSRRSTLALPSSALPGGVRELPPLPIITVTWTNSDA